MITDNTTNWRNVWAIHATMPSPPGLRAGLKPRNAIMANAYAHHIDPTRFVRKTAILALTPFALLMSVDRPRRLIACEMWCITFTGLAISFSMIASPLTAPDRACHF